MAVSKLRYESRQEPVGRPQNPNSKPGWLPSAGIARGNAARIAAFVVACAAVRSTCVLKVRSNLGNAGGNYADSGGSDQVGDGTLIARDSGDG